jgi:hypothetical protein
MKDQERQRLHKSLQFLEVIQGSPLEHACARATVWDQDGHPVAKGEVYGEPTLDQADSGRFWPDDAELVDTLGASAKYLSYDWPHLVPIQVTKRTLPGVDDPHVLFVVTGPRTQHPV